MKPWAKLEQNYINHQKFLALTANAICLWHEGKNYCDMHQTDGLIPKMALKTFRFSSGKSIEALTRSCGLKPNGTAYAPLWEPIDIGGVLHYRMHDYLDHNDCRDAVLDRLHRADEERERDRERKRVAREAKAAKRAEAEAQSVRQMSAGISAGHPGKVRSITETELETETRREREERVSLSPPAAPSRFPEPKADPFTDPVVTERAGRFIERYQGLYRTHRKGAQYAVRPARDYAAAVTLCQTWTDDARLDRLATIFLLTDHKFAAEGSRTIPQFLALASWADGELAAHEAKRGIA